MATRSVDGHDLHLTADRTGDESGRFHKCAQRLTSYTSQTIVISELQLTRNDEASGKKFKVTGFLVRPFKAMRLHKAGGAVTGLFQAINPFSREKGKADNARFEGELSSVAWSSSVGWRAGGSSFANPVTHEIGMTALSVSR
jgi:hypothetical protein